MARDVEVYKAEIDAGDLGDTPCRCGNCDWTGAASLLDEIGDCGLSPGDPSPAGRCPDCDCITYLDRPIDRAWDALRDLIDAAGHGYPPGDSNLERYATTLSARLAEACPGLGLAVQFTGSK